MDLIDYLYYGLWSFAIFMTIIVSIWFFLLKYEDSSITEWLFAPREWFFLTHWNRFKYLLPWMVIAGVLLYFLSHTSHETFRAFFGR